MGMQFYRKNRLDLDFTVPVLTVTDATATDAGSDYLDLLRNRSNLSGWGTTGSNDAANTTIEVDFVDSVTFTDILLLGHNFKSYTLKYWDGSSFVDFGDAIAPTNQTKDSNYHYVGVITSQKVQLVITGTQTVDADKFLRQFIVAERLGELSVQPMINVSFNKRRRSKEYLSGKSHVNKSNGGVEMRVRKKNVTSDADLTLAEELARSYEGFLVSVTGGDDSQYVTEREGFRLKDVYLMDMENDLSPAWEDGYYRNGMEIDFKLVEIN